jgi:nucleotide-binding universal stress UspA family protein
MYNKLLVPLDGSMTAEVVLPYARAFAAAANIPVDLLAVMDSETLIHGELRSNGNNKYEVGGRVFLWTL